MNTNDKDSSELSSLASTINITRRSDRSLNTHIFNKIIRPFGPSIIKPKKAFPAGSPRLEIPAKAHKKCNVTERQVESIWLYDIVAKDYLNTEKKHRIFYFAGGGWQSPASSHHWKYFAELTKRLPYSTLTVVSYPLAPHSPAPVAIPQLLKLYNVLLQECKEKGELVTFAGDSAGGNIVLALVIEALREDPTRLKPRSILAICPSVDLARTNPEIRKVEKYDPMMRTRFSEGTAEAWLGQGREDAWNCFDPRASPLHADLSVLRQYNVIVDGTIAGYDILGPDGTHFREKLQSERVRGEWLEWDKMMHCWPLSASYGLFPESKEAFDWIANLLLRRSEGN